MLSNVNVILIIHTQDWYYLDVCTIVNMYYGVHKNNIDYIECNSSAWNVTKINTYLANYYFQIITIPIVQGFGLIFKDRFDELKFSSTDTALIMNSSGAISMFCGIFNGPLLKSLGYRKVALISGCLTTLGVILTAQANSFLQYILTFGLITC